MLSVHGQASNNLRWLVGYSKKIVMFVLLALSPSFLSSMDNSGLTKVQVVSRSQTLTKRGGSGDITILLSCPSPEHGLGPQACHSIQYLMQSCSPQ